VDSVRRASPGFVGALLGRSHGICNPLLAFRSWRKRRSQTGECPADGLADHGALRVCVGMISLGLYAQLAILYVYTVIWRVHHGRERTPQAKPRPYDHVAPRESASIHCALKRGLMGIRETRRILRSLRHQQRRHAHWSRWSVSSTNRMRSSVGRTEMTDGLRRQLREVEQASVAPEDVIAVLPRS
jgi:hypothetical protein